jgi:transcription elongation factor Elf1
MQRHVNVSLTLACPRCRGELVVTLDQIHEQHEVRCAFCRARVPLEPEDLAPPGPPADPAEPTDFWVYG